MILDFTDMYLTVSSQKPRSTSVDSTSVDRSPSVNNECDGQLPKELPKREIATRDSNVPQCYEANIQAALREREDLMTEIEVRLEHIALLRKARERWSTMTEHAKGRLLRFHTEDDLNGTLIYEEETLRAVRYRVNSLDHQIEGLRRRNGSVQGVARVAQGSQDTEPVI